jgi:hypothetical protein
MTHGGQVARTSALARALFNERTAAMTPPEAARFAVSDEFAALLDAAARGRDDEQRTPELHDDDVRRELARAIAESPYLYASPGDRARIARSIVDRLALAGFGFRRLSADEVAELERARIARARQMQRA